MTMSESSEYPREYLVAMGRELLSEEEAIRVTETHLARMRAQEMTDAITVRPFIEKFTSLMRGTDITLTEGEYIIEIVKSRMRLP